MRHSQSAGEGPPVTVLIPARNEADRIAETLGGVALALQSAGMPVARILVIDDGSTDGTGDVARRAGAEVLRLDPNRGKGGALNAGLERAGGDLLVMLDADLGSSAAEMGKLLGPVVAGDADMTIAAFPAAGRSGGLGLVVGLSRWAVRRATGHRRGTMQMYLPRRRSIETLRRAARRSSGYFSGFQPGCRKCFP